ncbi:MAG: LPS assembly outer membrane complex protein LptD [Lentisphaerae bacterium ADurb.BinA184]|nr:MAG: LPS assembly outer membrane complex protein LptD [Lentisphaerae bacterium ADurb.BinA184]
MKLTGLVRIGLCVAATAWLAARPVHGQEASDAAPAAGGELDIVADNYELETTTGWATGSGNVKVTYQGLVLEADEVRANVETKDVSATGNIHFYALETPDSPELKRGFYWRGDRIEGNFGTREFRSGANTFQAGEWYGRGGDLQHQTDGTVVFHNVEISTCARLHDGTPHYGLDARKVVYRTDGTIAAHGAVYRVGRIPVFYLPYVAWDTETAGGNITFSGGYKSSDGAHVQVGRRWRLAPGLDTQVEVGYRSKRGPSLGNVTRYRTDRSDSEVELFGMLDDNPPETTPGYNRRFETEDERYRARLYHRQEFGDNWQLRLGLDALSDIDMLEEWFDGDFGSYRQPRTYADLRYDHDRFTAALGLRARVNDFYTVTERLPELRLDLPRQSVLGTRLQYQGQTSLANLRMKWRDFDLDRVGPPPLSPLLEDPADYETWRLDSVHMFYLPFDLRDGIRVTPRAGARLTYYENTSERAVDEGDLLAMFRVDDPDRETVDAVLSQYDDEGGDALRAAAEAGVEVTGKFYRSWEGARSAFWKVDGLRHIVQPYLNYTWISDPSEDREHLFYFDEVDRLVEQSFVRVGLDQRLQTRRGEGMEKKVYTLAAMESYADFHFDRPEGEEELGEAGDWVTRFRLAPREQLTLWGLVGMNLDEGTVHRVEAGVTFALFEALRLDIGYLYRQDEGWSAVDSFGSTLADYTADDITALVAGESHYLSLDMTVLFNEKTTGRARFEFDLVDDDLSRQVYEVVRDLHCWMGGVRVEEDDGEFAVRAILYLKAFPQVGAH